MPPVGDLNLIDTVTFTGADFSIQHDGVCRMNPELARSVAQVACAVGYDSEAPFSRAFKRQFGTSHGSWRNQS
jgi:AraC-like DNA-binding protein